MRFLTDAALLSKLPLAVHLLAEAPTVFTALQVANFEISPTVPITYGFDEVRIEAVLHLAKHNIFYLDLAVVSYWLESANFARIVAANIATFAIDSESDCVAF